MTELKYGMKIKALFFTLLLFWAVDAFGQNIKPATWSYELSKSEVQKGETIELIFKANIIEDWYLYSSDFELNPGPQVTTFEFEPNNSYELEGEINPINPKKKYDDIFEGEYTYFVGQGEFRQKVKILEDNPSIKGYVSYQVCTDVDGKCIPFEEEFSFEDIKVVASNDNKKPGKQNDVSEQSTSEQSTDQNEAGSTTNQLVVPQTTNNNDTRKKKASWSITSENENTEVGDTITLVLKAEIAKDWHLYSSEITLDPGPNPTVLIFEDHPSYKPIGELVAIDPLNEYDEIFEGELEYFKDEATFHQKIIIQSPNVKFKGTVEYQVCNENLGQCIPEYADLSYSISATGESISETNNKDTLQEADSEKGNGTQAEKSKLVQRSSTDPYSLLAFMVVAFLAGLAAIFTPCVFPMIPMTVTFFTGKAKSRAQGIRNALIYGFSIILIYTIVGAIIAPFMGPGTANEIATNAPLNVAFFLIFVVFALSFFGLFDINLPSSFINKVDRKADQGGIIGIFFMAFTLVVVSFSCTGPIAGGILFESAGGQTLKPILGMLAFGIAFGIPFTLFAIFPDWLNSLPKSGGWLNSIKVTLGFIELGFSLKFLSIADQVSHWGILDREVYLAIWIVILFLLGFYLLGKIKLPHDSDLPHVSVPRFMLVIIVFSFAVYLIPGMFGAPLKALSGYLPPSTTHDFNLSKLLIERGGSNNASEDFTSNAACEDPKYSDFLHLPHGLSGYFDYDQAIKCAKAIDKPVFIDFTGHGCVNCREMEARVWSDPRVLKILREDYIVLALYVDDKTELPEDEWYVSEEDDRLKNTIGRQNLDFEISRFDNPAQPYYVLLGPNEEKLTEPIGYTRNTEAFIEFLEEGKRQFNEKYRKN